MFSDYCCRCCGFTLIKRHGAVSLKTTPSDTWLVLQNLLMCTLCFYSLYYVAVSLCVGLLRVHEINSLLAPFDYTTQPSWQNPKYLVMSDFPSTEHWWIALGEMLNVFPPPLIKRSTAFLVSSTSTYSAGLGLVMMIFGGQALAYKVFRSNFVYPAELQNF
ncbi:transmembrane protein 244 isoform X3 [Syngnathus typhle]|uniref:transmembrane protein 244 isoform X3 n=1 Tax=Syngnathus typhle TaxID=161592 RepID=UPI002A6B58AC|nr:transmembrane protein 244 isoform X3 [Syngnathus typhle]